MFIFQSMISKHIYLADYKLFCEMTVKAYLSANIPCSEPDSLKPSESITLKILSNAQELKSALIGRATCIAEEFRCAGAEYSYIRHELAVIAHASMQNYIAEALPSKQTDQLPGIR